MRFAVTCALHGSTGHGVWCVAAVWFQSQSVLCSQLAVMYTLLWWFWWQFLKMEMTPSPTSCSFKRIWPGSGWAGLASESGGCLRVGLSRPPSPCRAERAPCRSCASPCLSPPPSETDPGGDCYAWGPLWIVAVMPVTLTVAVVA